MTRPLFRLAAPLALVALAACAPPRTNDSLVRDTELRGTQAPLSALEPISSEPLDGTGMATAGDGGAGTDAGSTQAVTTASGLSAEQDFDAVSGQRDIEDDAARIAAARAQYRVIQPGALPVRPGTNVPNIVEYAVRTNNPVGVQIYARSGFSTQNRFLRNCAGYASPDLAQEDFLSRGGPERDRRGIDPDGDGFACGWDPRPFRRAVAPPQAGPQTLDVPELDG